MTKISRERALRNFCFIENFLTRTREILKTGRKRNLISPELYLHVFIFEFFVFLCG